MTVIPDMKSTLLILILNFFPFHFVCFYIGRYQTKSVLYRKKKKKTTVELNIKSTSQMLRKIFVDETLSPENLFYFFIFMYLFLCIYFFYFFLCSLFHCLTFCFSKIFKNFKSGLILCSTGFLQYLEF